jgi:hypothetical protein
LKTLGTTVPLRVTRRLAKRAGWATVATALVTTRAAATTTTMMN